MLRTIDRVPTKALSNGAVRHGIYDDKGALIRYEYIKREDEPSEQGDAINRALFENFLDVGTIVQTDADLSNDDRFLPCNGIFLQQDEYPELYGKIGYKYGGGDAIGGYGMSDAFETASNCAVQIGLYNDYESTIIAGDFDNFTVLRGYELYDNEENILRHGSNDESIELLDGIINQHYQNYGVVSSSKSIYGATIFKGLFLTSLGSGIYSHNFNDSTNAWTLRLSSSKTSLPYFAQNDNVVVTLISDGSNWYIYSSADGIAWTKRLTVASTQTNYEYCDVKYKNGIFLAKIAQALYRSTNGTNWTSVTPVNLSVPGSGGLIATDKHFVLLYNGINYSEDGITWSNKALPTGVSLYKRKVLGSLITSKGVFYDINGGFRIPFAKGRWIKVK